MATGLNESGSEQAHSSAAGVICLADGVEIAYRPIDPMDRVALQRFHGRHSDRSIYLRFFTHQRELGEDQARFFTVLDGASRFALIALDPNAPDEIIAVVRFDREEGTAAAEYAAIVADAWQGRGLGSQLTHRLIDCARERGIASFFAYVLPENERMLNLFRDLGFPETARFEDWIERVDIDIRGNASPGSDQRAR